MPTLSPSRVEEEEDLGHLFVRYMSAILAIMLSLTDYIVYTSKKNTTTEKFSNFLSRLNENYFI